MSDKSPPERQSRSSLSNSRTKASPTKSMKNKSLPSTKISSRYLTAKTSSKTLSGQRATNVKETEEALTPEKNGGGTNKACSTPTNNEDTISDLTLDASCISTVKSNTDIAEQTVSKAPVMKMKSTTAVKPTRGNQSIRNSSNKTMLAPRLSGTARKAPVLRNNFKSAMKQVSRDLETLESDPDEVTDDMMETAYFRYLQAKFIAMKSKEARKKVEEDSRNQILQAFFALEEVRMEVQQRSMEEVQRESITAMKSSLTMVEQNLVPVQQALNTVKADVESVASSLDGIKDNLVVQGINLGGQEDTLEEVKNLEKMFSKFNEDMAAYRDIAKANDDELEKISNSSKELSDNYSDIVQRTRSVKKLLKESESLAVHKASLAISLRDIGARWEE